METRIAELIREAALDGVRDELPHSLAVLVDEIVPARGPDRPAPTSTRRSTSSATRRRRSSWAARGLASQFGRHVGRRPQIEELLGTQVYLSLHVTVAKEWQRDPKQLRRLGFDA